MRASTPLDDDDDDVDVADVRADRPSAPSVCGPMMPSTIRPWARWKRRTARRVCGP
jgi:hypothetical protein